jgi:hypothetical protein
MLPNSRALQAAMIVIVVLVILGLVLSSVRFAL